MNNKKLGNKFERELCERLSGEGFWVHRLTPSATGAQPFDIIAIRNRTAIAIDCKVCSNNAFSFSRVEANQDAAMQKWTQVSELPAYFALQLSAHDVRWLHYNTLNALIHAGITGLTKQNAYKHTLSTEEICESY